MTAESTYRHESVLAAEAVEIFRSLPAGWLVDGTVGGGGLAEAVLAATAGSDLRLLGLDVDPDAVAAATGRLAPFRDRVRVVRASYAGIAGLVAELGLGALSGAVLDLGMSSAHVDGERGFSYRRPGPLDMRFDPDQPHTARAVVDLSSESQLADLLWKYGEIRGSRRLARGLKEAAGRGRLVGTEGLVEVVRELFPNGGSKLLSRLFQALRIAVNGELDNLAGFLAEAPGLLGVGGRLAIISFHSLEDRMVKQSFRELARGGEYSLGCRKPISPGEEEVRVNRRAHSAHLRWLERVA